MGETLWTPTPGTETFGMIQKSISGYALMPEDPEVLESAAAGVRRAIDRLNTRPWNWLITYDDIAFVTGTTDYPLTSWFKTPRNFEIWNTSNQSVFRLHYKPWKTFLVEHQDFTAQGDPTTYSCANVNALGSVSLNAAPAEGWIALYPNGRLWYFRKVQYPVNPGRPIDVPSEVVGFIQSSAEGYVADRYAPSKAAAAYSRAERFHHELVVDDAHGGQTDWE